MNKNQLLEVFPIGPEIPDHRLCDPLSAIGAGAGLVGNLIGGGMQASAAKDAAKMQQQAAQQAGQQVVDTTNQVNPQIGAAADKASQGVTDASGAAATGVTNAAATAGTGATNAAGTANDLLNPYIDAGKTAATTLNGMIGPNGQLNQNFTADNFQQLDPGYNFRLQQAQAALQRSAAAHGGALGGGAAKDLTQFSQDYASNEFNNAFNRYQTQQTGQYNRLMGASQLGLGASNTAGQNLIGTNEYAGTMGFNGALSAGNFGVGGAQYAGNAGMNAADLTASNSINASKAYGDYLTQGANAAAAGRVGSSNAMSGAITGGLGNVSNMLMLQKLMQNPATRGGGGGVTYTNNLPAGTDWTQGG